MVEIRQPQTPAEWEAYYDLRYRVLREPLEQPRGSERNEGDETGIHFALYEDNRLLAIARLDNADTGTAQVRFVAVETDQQRKGTGRKIMEAVELKCAEMNVQKIVLHARDYAVSFYQGMDYVLVAPSYKLFDVLQHFLMEKELSQ